MKVYESLIFNNLERIWNIYTLYTAISLAIYKQLSSLWIIRVEIVLKFKNLWIWPVTIRLKCQTQIIRL